MWFGQKVPSSWKRRRDQYIEVENGGGDAKKWVGLVNRGQLAADRGRALLSHAPSLHPYIAHSRCNAPRRLWPFDTASYLLFCSLFYLRHSLAVFPYSDLPISM